MKTQLLKRVRSKFRIATFPLDEFTTFYEVQRKTLLFGWQPCHYIPFDSFQKAKNLLSKKVIKRSKLAVV